MDCQFIESRRPKRSIQAAVACRRWDQDSNTGEMISMRIGIGLPAAVPGVPAGAVGWWAAEAERLGFQSVSVLDRLVYDNLDPLVALGAAAARTERVELLTTVLNVGYRNNALLLAKQLASVDSLSGGRLTPGLALGGWPEDYAASQVSLNGRGELYDTIVATLRRAWAGEITGAGGPMTPSRPGLLFGGLVPASFRRIAAHGQGWIAPFMGFEMLVKGIAGVREAWTRAGRAGRPRIVVERYFSLGPDGGEVADHYLAHYYGPGFAPARVDTLTNRTEARAELARLAEAGCDDVVLFPCSAGREQVGLLAEIVDDMDGNFADSHAHAVVPA